MPTSDRTVATPLHSIAQLYGFWVFNFMVDIATAIADDFTERPQHYQKVPRDLDAVLSGFRGSLGAHVDWPDPQQRISAFRVLGTACVAAAPLREAALVYVERGTELNRDLLLDAFSDAATSFRNQMKTIEGHAVEASRRQIATIFESALQLFRSDAVMRVFNLAPAPPDADWPMSGHVSAIGATLATELISSLDSGISARALLGGPKRETVGPRPPRAINKAMSQNKFTLLQQAAWYGRLAVSGTLADIQRREDLIPVIGNTYRWTKSLQRLIPDVVRVWTDPNYRSRLTDVEWGMVEPHPSGVADIVSFARGNNGPGFMTLTVSGEVCCCTGDLPCPASSNCEVSPGPSCINCGSLAAIQCGILVPK